MDKFDPRTRAIVERLQQARMTLLEQQPFYALLLLHMRFALDLTCETAYTDGTRIAFHPDFIDALSDSELEFVLMHEVLHAALGHPFRHQAQYDIECFDKACDIVVNSNILYSWGMDLRRITLNQFGEAMHLTPDGEEGYHYTIEQVYGKLMAVKAKQPQPPPPPPSQGGGGDGGNGGDGKGDDGKQQKDEDGNADGNSKDGKGQGGKGQDSDGSGSGDNSNGKGKGGKSKSKGGKGSGGDGDITDEDLQDLVNDLLKGRAVHGKIDPHADLKKAQQEATGKMGEVDNHSFWQGDDEHNIGRETWLNRMVQATDIVMEKQKAHKGYGGPPLGLIRLVKELTHPEVDWRVVLNDFVQEEINDYSFSPPDKRMGDCPFFLPDFNEKEERVKNVWFLIDTSGSIGDQQISAAYSEIVSAIDMFDGKLEGMLSFTEVFVTDPIPFCSEEELLAIKPVGGGGNDFSEIFRYLERNLMNDPPVSIIIFTDGYDYYPEEAAAMGIPVMWLINNEDAEPPPWGKWARFKIHPQ